MGNRQDTNNILLTEQNDILQSKKPIDALHNLLIEHAQNNGNYITELNTKINRLIRDIQIATIAKRNDGYCLKFAIPEKGVAHILDDVSGFTQDLVTYSFIKQWEIPSNAKMYTSLYYHNILLLTLYAIRNGHKKLAINLQKLLLFRLWNGRISTSFPKFCNPEYMNYVTSEMMNRKYLPNKYDTPLELIENYYCSRLIKKYESWLISDSFHTKTLFMRSYNALRQLFRSDKIPNILDPKKIEYGSGLSPLYYTAVKKGLKIGTVVSQGEDSSTIDTFSSHAFDDIIESTATFITMNTNSFYDDEFKYFLKKKELINIKKGNIDIIIKAIHKMQHSDFIHEILQLFFRRINSIDKNIICTNTFLINHIKKKIISSKHNDDVNLIKKAINDFLIIVFNEETSIKFDYNVYSDISKSQIRKVVIYAIGYNIKKHMCK